MTRASSIHHVGAPGLDGIAERSARRDRNIVVVIFHPETLSGDGGATVCAAMLSAFSSYFYQGSGFTHQPPRFVFTGVNKDPGHEKIESLIDTFCAQHPSTRCVMALPREAYISLLQEAKLVVGNSSSIPIECPWIGIPSVLVGSRQNGRELADSVHTPDGNIESAIARAISWEPAPMGYSSPIYRGGGVGLKIARIVREFVGERV